MSKCIDSAIARHPRVDEVWEGLKWRIARDPEAGLRVVEAEPPFTYVIRSAEPGPGVPVIRAVYQYNPSLPFKVDIRRIQVVA